MRRYAAYAEAIADRIAGSAYAVLQRRPSGSTSCTVWRRPRPR